MEPSEREKTEGGVRPVTKWGGLLSRHYKALAWIGFALWLLTMYAVLFQMGPLFS